MTRVSTLVILITLCLAALLLAGGRPERRYVDELCLYKPIWQDEGPVSLVSIGGSRLHYTALPDELDALLRQRQITPAAIVNLGHAYNSMEREYVLLRDMLARRPVKTALVMISPRGGKKGALTKPFFASIKLADWPLVGRIYGPTRPVEVVAGLWASLKAHLKPWHSISQPEFDRSWREACTWREVRSEVLKLEAAALQAAKMDDSPLTWDLDAPSKMESLAWAREMKALADAHGTALFFILVTAMLEPMPEASLVQDFRARTGAELIVFDRGLRERLNEDTYIDDVHLNQAGRAALQPWLIDQIIARCPRQDGCF